MKKDMVNAFGNQFCFFLLNVLYVYIFLCDIYD